MNALRYAAPLLLFIATLVSALLALAPASLLGVPVERATEGRLTLADATNKFWHGQANVIGAGSGISVPVMWRIVGVGVWPPEISVDVRVRDGDPVKVAARIGHLKLGRMDITLPALLAADAIKSAGNYRPKGVVRLRSDHLQIDGQSITGRVMVTWADAGLGGIDVDPLGSFDIDCDVTGTSGTATIKSTTGPLLANGGARWSQSSYALELEARGSGPRADVLTAWLRTVAVEKPDGAFSIIWPRHKR